MASEPVNVASGLSAWEVAALAVIGLLLVACLVEFIRWKSGTLVRFDLMRVGVLLIAALAGCFAFDLWTAHERASERRALEARAFELMMRATAPGSALGCLDAMAGEAIEASCEKALFGTPEAAAAALSYVSAQLALLAAGSDYARRVDASYANALAPLRRAAERDRFGIVAHVLAERDGCTAEQCAALAQLGDGTRVSINLAERTFETYVKRYAGQWSGEANRPLAANAPPADGPATAATAPIAVVRNPNTLFFPSSSSIPAVSIMSAEPGVAQDTTGSGEIKAARKPPVPQARPPANASAAPAAPAAPLQLAPAQ